MYTENTSIGELLELPQVMALLEAALTDVKDQTA